MRYGHFDDERHEYVVERPDTPMPWINYLGEGAYCAIVSNNAGGYSFRRSPGLGRLLRYRFNAVPVDRPGRYIYLRDRANGDYWTNSWSPVQKPLDQQRVTCRHGLGYTVIASEYRRIASEATYLVPGGEELEVWRVAVTNRGQHPRQLDLFAYCEYAIPVFAREFDLQYYLFTHFNAFRAGMASLRIHNTTDYARDAYFASLLPVESFDVQREAFIGPWRDESRPLAVERGRCGSQELNGGNACGALHLCLDLAPGQTWRNAFLLGSGKAEEAGVQARETFTLERIERELQDLAARWHAKLSAQTCRTPDREFDGNINVWNSYQAHTTFTWSRSASLIEAGGRDGFGYRDTLQDVMAVMHTCAEPARERVVDLLKGQHTRGCTLHAVQPLTLETGRGEDIPKCWSDDHLWILLAVGAYVRETGDLAFLERVVPWLDQGEASVYEHGRHALDFAAAQTGANGLLLGLCADWNDSLNLRRNRGESVFTSQLYCAALIEFAMLAEARGREADAAAARQRAVTMAATINERAWDGEWYLRAIAGDGLKIGSHDSSEARIFVESNTWAVLSGVADPARGRQAMDSLHQVLATPYGHMLCSPPYTAPEPRIGGMTEFPPGFKENGAIFCHAATWVIAAEAVLGRGDKAYDAYRRLLPRAHEPRSDLRQVEPYVYCQFIKGAADPGHGQGRNPWLTGTAAWAYLAGVQYILGLKPTVAGLRLDPCIPPEWLGFEALRRFRGASYRIQVHNPRHLMHGVRRLQVDGRIVEGDLIPLAEPGRECRVEATLEGR